MPDRETDLADLALLSQAARAAGSVLMSHFDTDVKVWNKAGTPVTEADHASNALLHETLQGARADYGWLSEETQDDLARMKARRLFVVDPLDGTVSFIKKRDDFTVSLAVAADGVPVVGVVYNPSRDELFAAVKGGGATLNGVPIKVSGISEIEGCRMIAARDMMEHPFWPQKWPAMELMKIGSIAYRLVLVACGRADATMALTSKSDWDIAAGEVIAREAGATVTSHDGATFLYNRASTDQISLLASTPGIYNALSARVSGLTLGPRVNP